VHVEADKLPPEIAEQVKEAVSILKSGGVVSYPTDTVYGLGALAENEEAVERIFSLKKRPRHMPLPLLVSDMAHLDELAATSGSLAWRLATLFWPGGLTLIVPASKKVPKFIGGGETVALRIPDDAVTLALIKDLGKPIVGTSANYTGRPAAVTADEVKRCFGGKVDLVIDAGRTSGGKESTIVDITGDKAMIVREGIVSRAQIAEVCPIE
jgi:L-threonylcarbamoyladenylate synthase